MFENETFRFDIISQLSDALKSYKTPFSNFLLRDEKWSGPDNSSRIFVYRYLNEEDILDAQFFTKKFSSPIHNRCLSYSGWISSPFW